MHVTCGLLVIILFKIFYLLINLLPEVRGSWLGRAGITRLPRGDNGGSRGALAILQGR